MIDSLTFVPQNDGVMPWSAKLDYFKKHPVTEFKSGLNIAFGANGSGKSTLLQLLGTALAAVQGGTSTVTSSWLQDVCGFDAKEILLPCDIVHDGQPVMYFDSRAKEGLIGGSFDDDFFSLGLANTLTRGSSGQLVLQRIDRMLQVLMRKGTPPAPPPAEPAATPRRARGKSLKDLERKGGFRSLVPEGFPSEIEWKIPRHLAGHKSLNARTALVEEHLRAKRAPGPKTLIFDEPESGFSLPWQAGIWANIFSKIDPEQFQVIVATHSPFALGIPGAHYIEMSPGYLLECQVATLGLMTRFMSKENAK